MTPIEIEVYKHYLDLMGNPSNRVESQETTADALIEKYDAFFFDAFGTLFNRKGYVYPGALEFMQKLKAAGKHVRMVTNAATNTAFKVSEDMKNMGFEVLPEHIFSSGRYVLEFQKNYGFKEVFYAGRPGGVQMLNDFGIAAVENPEIPVVAFCSTEPSEERLKHAEEILSRPGAVLLILNPDACAPELDGSRSEVSGIQSYRIWKRTCCKYEICGKPFKGSFDDAIESVRKERVAMGLPNARIIMFGDTLGTDVAGAYVAGVDSCLVMGRNMRRETFDNDCLELGFTPNYIIDGF